MILEIAILNIKPGQSAAFQVAFAQAQPIIATMPGYLGHELQRCLDEADKYALLVRWRSVEDHEIGFRKSPEYARWKALLHHFYDPFPLVQHYQKVDF